MRSQFSEWLAGVFMGRGSPAASARQVLPVYPLPDAGMAQQGFAGAPTVCQTATPTLPA